jgi:DNA-binding NarL/FixJ family response regulator
MSCPLLVRFLLVDDFDALRSFIRTTLQGTQFQIIAEVSDGLEAIQKAEELQPDLILLDIGLPNLNGIEAARRIRKRAPRSKILFLSQESSSDVVAEALKFGTGYVVKTHAGGELLATIEAMRATGHFVTTDRQPTLVPPTLQNAHP